MPASPSTGQDQSSTFITIFIVCVVLIILGLVLYSSLDDGTDEYEIRRDRIRGCIAMGGDPNYAVDEDGYITEYFGCVM